MYAKTEQRKVGNNQEGTTSMQLIEKHIIVPDHYQSPLDIRETEVAIKLIKDYFERELASQLNLTRVSAPLFVRPETGLNDNLNGVERPVSFDVKAIGGREVEVVHSLAKWKRAALKRYQFKRGEGLYTDMNAIRRDEDTDNLHSIYVDQWDWEVIISKEERTLEHLEGIVDAIYTVLRKTEHMICCRYSALSPVLPEEISFVTAQELEDMYPDLSSKAREDAICQKRKAVFIIGIGDTLASGHPHDGRAPDYDDWNLNGDILCWFPTLNRSMELSSMGIRVDREALACQLKAAGCEERMALPFHQGILQDELPLTMGGGIGQSRLCMFFLQKAHIGEVQASVWPEEIMEACAQSNILLL